MTEALELARAVLESDVVQRDHTLDTLAAEVVRLSEALAETEDRRVQTVHAWNAVQADSIRYRKALERIEEPDPDDTVENLAYLAREALKEGK